PLDFAYAIHTDVGHHCVGSKVNGRMVPLRHTLKSGDTVEIITSKTQSPSKDWLNIAKSSRAKTKIKQWLLKIERESSKSIGKDILEKAFRVFGTSLPKVLKSGDLKKACRNFNATNEDELFIMVGSGKFNAREVVDAIPSIKKDDVKKEEKISEIDSYTQKLAKSVKKKSHRDNAVIVDGMDDLMVRMARCCNPIPGDPILGYITRGRGITVHHSSCNRVEDGELARTVDVEWNSEFSFKHPVNVRVITHDKPGILSLISKAITGIKVNIRSAIAKSLPDRKGSFIFEIEVKDYSELLKTICTIESLEEVISVTRV
ncbi:MAG: bifunctional (p)ppGpp synthetase/guanosine-3',5'-bis(diphosphate) 3'-pyrophosphohydrolase, partial [Bacteriovoracaceae bacterium]|nr:bifunctional (p)ppGpp synthetase/guanosine-3',5'-bis(diphosphate) 3'-pyrophosphohydrolase [Bacteriovoracaceae bacterium]